MSNMNMDIGMGFRIARVMKKVLQGEAAKGLNLSQNYLSLIENNHVIPSFKVLARARNYYEVPISLLLQESKDA